jgi:hypothetical protein
VSFALLWGWVQPHQAWAGSVWNVEAAAGRGLTAANLTTDQLWAPWYGQLQVGFLPLVVGPVAMGPVLGLTFGGFQEEESGQRRVQFGQHAGWQCYGRPTIDWAWSAVASLNIVDLPVLALGLELGGTAAYFLTAGIALTAGLRYSFHYGVDGVHVFAGQIGVLLSYEVIR